MRFMCVGDSMTVGRPREATWRYWIWRHLRTCAACGVPRTPLASGAGRALRVDGDGDGRGRLVGPWTDQYTGGAEEPATGTVGAEPPAVVPPAARAHLSAWGEGWLHMAGRIRGAVADCRPDVLLISLGLIDLGFYTDSGQTDGNVRAFFAEAYAADPGLRAVVLPVVPNVRAETDAPFAAEVARFNGVLARTVAELALAGSSVVLAASPLAAPVAYDIHRDTYDGTHPAPSGERKLAAAFVGALHGTAPEPSASWESPADRLTVPAVAAG